MLPGYETPPSADIRIVSLRDSTARGADHLRWFPGDRLPGPHLRCHPPWGHRLVFCLPVLPELYRCQVGQKSMQRYVLYIIPESSARTVASLIVPNSSMPMNSSWALP